MPSATTLRLGWHQQTWIQPGALASGGGHQKKTNQEKKVWEGAVKGSSLPLTASPWPMSAHICDKQQAVPAQEPPRQGHPWDICCSQLPSIFAPGLDTFPLFPGLMEASEKPFPPFAPGTGAKIHLFVNKISLKSSPNSKRSSKVGTSRSTFIK